jgi:hypothetical protein
MQGEQHRIDYKLLSLFTTWVMITAKLCMSDDWKVLQASVLDAQKALETLDHCLDQVVRYYDVKPETDSAVVSADSCSDGNSM